MYLITGLVLFGGLVNVYSHQPVNYAGKVCVEGKTHPLEQKLDSTYSASKVLENLIPAGSVTKNKLNHYVSAKDKIEEEEDPNLIPITLKDVQMKPRCEECAKEIEAAFNEIDWISEVQSIADNLLLNVNFRFQSTGPAHQQTIVSTCLVGEHSVQGKGSSKASAKQSAARGMLKILKAKYNCNVNKPKKHIDIDPEVDPISYITEWSKQTVRFEEIDVDSTMFSVDCVLNGLRMNARGKTKKIAKKLSAHAMIDHLLHKGIIKRPRANKVDQKPVQNKKGTLVVEYRHHPDFYKMVVMLLVDYYVFISDGDTPGMDDSRYRPLPPELKKYEAEVDIERLNEDKKLKEDFEDLMKYNEGRMNPGGKENQPIFNEVECAGDVGKKTSFGADNFKSEPLSNADNFKVKPSSITDNFKVKPSSITDNFKAKPPSNADNVESKPSYDDTKDAMDTLVKEMGYEDEFRGKYYGDTHFSFVTISSNSHVTCFGFGSDENESRRAASRAAIEYVLKELDRNADLIDILQNGGSILEDHYLARAQKYLEEEIGSAIIGN